MAGVVDVLLRIVGDSRDAVRSVDEIGAAADRSATRVGRLSQSLTSMARRVAGIGTAVVGTVEGLQEVYGRLDQMFNPNPQEDLSGATSGADTASRLRSAGGLRFSDFADPRNLLGRGTLFGDRRAGERQRVRAAIDALAASNAAQLADAIPFLPADYADYAAQQLARQSAAATYQERLNPSGRGAGGPTVVNVYQGVGDRNATGREVRAALDARDRNNGRYVTTYTRR